MRIGQRPASNGCCVHTPWPGPRSFGQGAASRLAAGACGDVRAAGGVQLPLLLTGGTRAHVSRGRAHSELLPRRVRPSWLARWPAVVPLCRA